MSNIDTIKFRSVKNNSIVPSYVEDIFIFYVGNNSIKEYEIAAGYPYNTYSGGDIIDIRLSCLPVINQAWDDGSKVSDLTGFYLEYSIDNINYSKIYYDQLLNPNTYSFNSDDATNEGVIKYCVGNIFNDKKVYIKIKYRSRGSVVHASDVNELSSGELLKDSFLKPRHINGYFDLTNKTLRVDRLLLNMQSNQASTYDSAVSKSYVDSLIAGLDIKESVKVATTSQLSGIEILIHSTVEDYDYLMPSTPGEQTLYIDGVQINVGDRILIKDGISGISINSVPMDPNCFNGIYILTTTTHHVSGSDYRWLLRRADDFYNSSSPEIDGFDPSSPIGVSNGAFVNVDGGNTNSQTSWILSVQGPIVCTKWFTQNDTPLPFVQYYNINSRWLVNGNNLYNSNNGAVCINSSSPVGTEKLYVNGDLRLSGGINNVGNISSNGNLSIGDIGCSNINSSGNLILSGSSSVSNIVNISNDNPVIKISSNSTPNFLDSNTGLWTDKNICILNSTWDYGIRFRIDSPNIGDSSVVLSTQTSDGIVLENGGQVFIKDWVRIGSINRQSNEKITLDGNAVLNGNVLLYGNSRYIGTTDNNKLNIITNNLNRITITENGNVGFGDESPSERLAVYGNIKINSYIKCNNGILKYDSDNKWKYSNDGINYFDIGSGSGGNGFQILNFNNPLSWNAISGKSAKIVLTGNTILNSITNSSSGDIYYLIVQQDSSGGRNISFGSDFKWASGFPPVNTTSPNAIDIYTFLFDGTNYYSVVQNNFS